MAWRIVKQPDGLYATFSEVVDEFTVFDMTREEAIEECREKMGRLDAIEKVNRADQNPGRWAEAKEARREAHKSPSAETTAIIAEIEGRG